MVKRIKAEVDRTNREIVQVLAKRIDNRPTFALSARPYPQPGLRRPNCSGAQMAELVDAPASGAGARKGVEVRVLFWAPFTHSAVFSDGFKSRRNLLFLTLD